MLSAKKCGTYGASVMVLLATLLFSQCVQRGAAASSCHELVEDLANVDRLLGENTVNPRLSRLQQKWLAAVAVANSQSFYEVFKYFKSQGNGFSCGYTSEWIGELFEGLKSQYPVYKAGGSGDNYAPNTAAGYVGAVGADLTALFRKYADSPSAHNFYMYHGGAADHVWQVSQLPRGQGYRVYQSYNSVYSLKAWLAPATVDLNTYWSSDPSRGDVVPNLRLYNTADQTVRSLTNGTFNITTLPSPEMIPNPLLQMIAMFVQYWRVQSVDKTTIIRDLANSKSKYGNGVIIPKDKFFSGYLAKLANLTTWYDEVAGKTPGGKPTIVPKDMFDLWTELFGSPNPTLAPGVPFNAVVGMLLPDKTYFFQVRVVKVAGDARTCANNAKLLYRAVNRSMP